MQRAGFGDRRESQALGGGVEFPELELTPQCDCGSLVPDRKFLVLSSHF
jgi:hypothetical protein